MKKYKHRLISSDYSFSESYVKIGTPLGVFEGKAAVDPEDWENGSASRFFGPRLAEYRAYIKYLKAIRHDLKIKMATTKHIYNMIRLTDIRNKVKIGKELEKITNEYNEVDEQIKNAKATEMKMIEGRTALVKSIQEKKAKTKRPN